MEIKSYNAPQVKVIEVNVQNVLCKSKSKSEGNDPMLEYDYDDGGFENDY